MDNDVQVLIVLNFSTEPVSFSAASEASGLVERATLILGNMASDGEKLEKTVDLQGYEGRVYILYKE